MRYTHRAAGYESLLRIKERLPDALFLPDEDETLEWRSSGFAELADALGTKYPNLSAIENDRRAIGRAMARKLGEVLKVENGKFL